MLVAGGATMSQSFRLSALKSSSTTSPRGGGNPINTGELKGRRGYTGTLRSSRWRARARAGRAGKGSALAAATSASLRARVFKQASAPDVEMIPGSGGSGERETSTREGEETHLQWRQWRLLRRRRRKREASRLCTARLGGAVREEAGAREGPGFYSVHHPSSAYMGRAGPGCQKKFRKKFILSRKSIFSSLNFKIEQNTYINLRTIYL